MPLMRTLSEEQIIAIKDKLETSEHYVELAERSGVPKYLTKQILICKKRKISNNYYNKIIYFLNSKAGNISKYKGFSFVIPETDIRIYTKIVRTKSAEALQQKYRELIECDIDPTTFFFLQIRSGMFALSSCVKIEHINAFGEKYISYPANRPAALKAIKWLKGEV